MTAVTIFDLLASDSPQSTGEAGHLPQFAERLISTSLAKLQHLREYERELAGTSTNNSDLDLKLARSIWQLYQEWSQEAEQVLDRARSLKGIRVNGVDLLDDAIGRTLARLTVSPERVAIAKQQAAEGQFVPAKELRDELNARLRA